MALGRHSLKSMAAGPACGLTDLLHNGSQPVLKTLIRIALSAASSILFMASTASAQEVFTNLSSRPVGQIHFHSVTPQSRFELARHGSSLEKVVVWGDLSFPAAEVVGGAGGSVGPVPAMVIAHGSAGVQPKDLVRWVPFFNKMGIATFVVDSFKPRHIDSTVDDQSVLDQAANDADALSALKLLATDPRIDRARIGIIGFSRGGAVALETAVEPFRKGIISDSTRFAAHIAFYTGCLVRYWATPSPMTGAPIMMALAAKDDYTPPQPCIDYANTMKAAGLDVETHVYEGAYHDFDNTVRYFKYWPGAQTSRNCPPSEINPVTFSEYRILETGQTFKASRDFAQAVNYAKCGTRGVSTGSDFSAAKKAEEDVRHFVVTAFRL